MGSEGAASHCYPWQPKGFARRSGALIKAVQSRIKSFSTEKSLGTNAELGVNKAVLLWMKARRAIFCRK